MGKLRDDKMCYMSSVLFGADFLQFPKEGVTTTNLYRLDSYPVCSPNECGRRRHEMEAMSTYLRRQLDAKVAAKPPSPPSTKWRGMADRYNNLSYE